jgi:hypothetical protein
VSLGPCLTFVFDSARKVKDFCFQTFLAGPLQPTATGEKSGSIWLIHGQGGPFASEFEPPVSIPSLSGSTGYQGPLQKLEAELQGEVSNGTISPSAESHLTSALSDVDSEIESSGSSSSTKRSPFDMSPREWNTGCSRARSVRSKIFRVRLAAMRVRNHWLYRNCARTAQFSFHLFVE